MKNSTRVWRTTTSPLAWPTVPTGTTPSVLQIGQFTEIFPSLDESDDINGRMDTRAIYQMTEDMIAQFQWVWDWDNTPAAGRDRSDNLFLVTVGWIF